MKKIITILVLLVSFLSFSQEIKLKKGEVLVDGISWLYYQDCGTFSETCSLLDKNKEEIIFFKWIKVPDGEPRTPSNPQGNLTYVEVKFLGLNQVFEIQKTQKNIILLLYNSKVVKDDLTLDEEKVSRLIEKYGSEFSDRLNRTTNNTNTIIIKEEPRRSGININLGR